MFNQYTISVNDLTNPPPYTYTFEGLTNNQTYSFSVQAVNVNGSSNSSNIINGTPTSTPVPISNICFPAKTPVSTDQGIISIEKINPEIHTINNKKIVGITQTIHQNDYLVCFEKHALGFNYPSAPTTMTKDHKIYYRGKMRKASYFLHDFEKIKKVDYDGEILYNVLMEKHEKIKINHLVCETLHPRNIIAKLYTSSLDKNYKNKITIMLNDSIHKNDYSIYKKIIEMIDDGSLDFENEDEDPVEVEEEEEKQPIIEKKEEKIDIKYDAKKSGPIVFNCLSNTNLQTKMEKYVISKQNVNNDPQKSGPIVFNCFSNTNLQSKMEKYISKQNANNDVSEIMKKKEFLEQVKKQKEEKEIESRNKYLARDTKTKTYKNKETTLIIVKNKTYKNK